MKRIASIISAAIISAASAAIPGVNSYTAGYMSGADAWDGSTANRSVGVGAFSLWNIQMGSPVDFSSFLGYQSGAKTVDLSDCVGIGQSALFDAHGCRGLVGIGSGAFAGARQKYNATMVNGHFFADEEKDAVYISPTASRGGESAPIGYQRGRIRLNAEVVGADGTVLCKGIWDEDDAPYGFHLYVSPGGLDTNDGSTPHTAKRTLDGAIDAIPYGYYGAISVEPGVYHYPTNGYKADLEKSYAIIAVGGHVTITTNEVSTSSRWWNGRTDTMVRVVGVDFDGFQHTTVGVSNSFHPTFYGLDLKNCTFYGQKFQLVGISSYPFAYCSLDNVTISGCEFSNVSTRDMSMFDALLFCCACRGLKFVGNTCVKDPGATKTALCLGRTTSFEDCLCVDTNAVWGNVISTVDISSRITVKGSTFVFASGDSSRPFADSTTASRATFEDCIVAYGAGATAASAANVGTPTGCAFAPFASWRSLVATSGRGIGRGYFCGWNSAERVECRQGALCAVDADRPVRLEVENGVLVVYTVAEDGTRTRLGTVQVSP